LRGEFGEEIYRQWQFGAKSIDDTIALIPINIPFTKEDAKISLP